ncbi:MAG TPA: hydrogenase expression/formation protein HypE [Chitinophagaceae bacterium]|nr:hydrogenase expression/formation protein HypE [Chitinophagaceae bacterium]HQV59629.1 hydrogenase expression/formation protein HypE [Chitinophagaceae bacterium]HQV85637.1 hydrogenase expression/formation protein HypE [Chitinophagaceae bacterium]HQX71666.1 hydrogenase expression/formation protein HypE [Chitinophagaceae bacterium]HQZ74487.1 hydrogenase expression/formation protein HypE [Chitinophagaceae bacterium]
MELQCPMPKFDFDVITLGHGSGGLLTHKLLQSGVFDIFKNELLNQQHDGASFSLNGRVAFSTDSYVITPAFFPGGNIGELAINGTVNDLAMCGAIPQYLSLSFIIEEGLTMKEFWEILVHIKEATQKAKIKIVTGDTKVVEKGKGDKIFINTSGVGLIHPKANIHHNNIRPGDKIIISGNIATHGIAIMSVRKGLEFETTIESDTTNLNHTIEKLLDRFGNDIKFLRDPTRGGVASVLNEIAELTSLGFELDQKSIPVDEQVEGACEMLGLDPLYVANEGLFVAVVAKEIADELLSLLRYDENGATAAIIGEVNTEHPGKVLMKSRIGGRRVVNYLTGEQLPRIC